MRRKLEHGAHLYLLPGASLAEADDATLARALIERDPLAPRVLWKRYAPMVHRMLRRTLGPGQELEDIAQEVFLCVFEKVAGLREPKALKAFVISITALTARGELRRRWVRRWVRLPGTGDAPDARGVSVDSDAREAVRRFYAILDRVNAADRTVFVLRFLEGMELTEVAAATGLSLATTKRRLAKVWSRVTTLVERDPSLIGYMIDPTAAPDESAAPAPAPAQTPVPVPVPVKDRR
jgi:RNA polymerase sigma-70 factor (ECF subfamily)